MSDVLRRMRRDRVVRSPLVALSSGVLALGVAVAMSVAGCFSERVSSAGPTGPVTGECHIPVGSPIIGATGALIAIRNFSFQPETLHVKPGTTVTWLNCENTGIDAHTSTADAGAWDSPFIAPGAAFSHTFDGTGAFDYHCTPHPFMKGVVIVD